MVFNTGMNGCWISARIETPPPLDERERPAVLRCRPQWCPGRTRWRRSGCDSTRRSRAAAAASGGAVCRTTCTRWRWMTRTRSTGRPSPCCPHMTCCTETSKCCATLIQEVDVQGRWPLYCLGCSETEPFGARILVLFSMVSVIFHFMAPEQGPLFCFLPSPVHKGRMRQKVRSASNEEWETQTVTKKTLFQRSTLVSPLSNRSNPQRNGHTTHYQPSRLSHTCSDKIVVTGENTVSDCYELLTTVHSTFTLNAFLSLNFETQMAKSLLRPVFGLH